MSELAAGRHPVRVVSHVLGKASTGTGQIAVLFEDANGDRLTWYGYLSDAALERTINSLALLGWDPVANDGRIDSLNGTDLLVGAEAEIVVEMETYNGETRPKVKWVNAVGGSLGKGLEQDDAKAMAASLRQKILSAPRPKVNVQPAKAAAGGKAAAGAKAGKSLNEPDDDLPF